MDTEKPNNIDFDKNTFFSLSMRIMKSIFVSLTGTLAILTVLGFISIQSYLIQIVDLPVYNISVNTYVRAGINSVINIILYPLREILPITIVATLILLTGVIVIVLISYFVDYKNSQKTANLVNNLEKTTNSYRTITSPIQIWLKYPVTTIITSIIFCMFAGIFYGAKYYPHTPHWLGGGQPVAVILTFNDEQPLNLWNFAINLEQPRLSEPLQLLIELNDGVLVRQAEGYPAVIVKNHIIDAIQDASIPMPKSEN